MNVRRHHTTADAFTMVEVMVAAAVMLMTIVGMMTVITYGSEMLDTARKQTIAMQIIHGQIDHVRLSDWSTISGYPSSRTVNVDDTDQTTNIGYGFVLGPTLRGLAKDFDCTRTISTVRTDLKQITFSVTWSSNTGRSHTRSGSTYFGKNGLYVTYQR